MLLSVFIVSLSQAGARLSAGAILRLTNPCYHSFLTTALATFMEFEKNRLGCTNIFNFWCFRQLILRERLCSHKDPKGRLWPESLLIHRLARENILHGPN